MVPALSAITTLLLLPVIARVGGADGWLAVGVGQSVGAMAAIAIALGWTLHGPRLVAGRSLRVARLVFIQSVHQRTLSSLVVLPLAGASAVLLAHDAPYTVVTLAAMLSMAVGGFSPGWYWVGIGRPLELLLYEALPRLVGNILSVPIVIVTGDVLWYPVISTVSTASAYLVHSRSMKVPLPRPTRASLASTVAAMRANTFSAATTITASLYTSASVSLVSAIVPTRPAVEFLTGDRIYKISVQMIGVAGNSLQGWVSEPKNRAQFVSRARISVALHCVLGAAGGMVLVLVGPWFSAALLGEEVAVSQQVMIGYGVAFFALAVNSGLGRTVLAALGLQRTIFLSTAAGALIGFPSLVVGAATLGAVGASAAVALAEVTVVGVQVGALVWRRWGHAHR
ncbi:hypothetical protein GCM10009739_11310 [Microbacterium ulmi]